MNTDGLITMLDLRNPLCINGSNTAWKFARSRDTDLNDEFTVPVGLYDDTTKSFSLNGIDDVLSLPKTKSNKIKFPSTMSIFCKPMPGSYIFNDINSLILYYSKSKNLVLQSTPLNGLTFSYSGILIDSNNDITLLQGPDSYNKSAIKFNINGDVIKNIKWYDSYTYAYNYGKIVEYNNLLYISSYGGWSTIDDLFNYGTTTHVRNALHNIHQGDCDISNNYIYLAGGIYHSIHKILLSDNSIVATFGTGTAGSTNTTLNTPRGVAVGTNYVFVGDSLNERVVVLNKSDMTYYSQLGTTGTNGSSNTLFNYPRNPFIKNGKLYITDVYNHRIKIYNEVTLTYIDSIILSYQPSYISVNNTYISIIASQRLIVIKLSDKSIIFEKTFKSLLLGPGGMKLYGAKSIGIYNDTVHIAPRWGGIFNLNTNTLNFTSTPLTGEIDGYSFHTDADYHYRANGYYGDSIQLINKSTGAKEYTIGVSGSGNGEFNAPYDVITDNTYIYVADTYNHRIQLFLKSNRSYHSQFGVYGSTDDGAHFRSPYCLAIDNGKLYVGDYENYKIRIYTQSTLVYIESFLTNIKPYKLKIYGGKIYIQYYEHYRVYDQATLTLLLSKSLPEYGRRVGYVINGYGFEVSEKYIFHLNQFKLTILDRETLEIITDVGVWYKNSLIDEKITDEKMLIDVVFTSDYKIKIIANGNESNTVQWSSTDDFQSIKDMVFGNILTDYSELNIETVNFYDRERTVTENLEDYNRLMKRN